MHSCSYFLPFVPGTTPTPWVSLAPLLLLKGRHHTLPFFYCRNLCLVCSPCPCSLAFFAYLYPTGAPTTPWCRPKGPFRAQCTGCSCIWPFGCASAPSFEVCVVTLFLLLRHHMRVVPPPLSMSIPGRVLLPLLLDPCVLLLALLLLLRSHCLPPPLSVRSPCFRPPVF